MKRLAVFALAIAGVIGGVPATSGALPPGVVPGPNSITGTVTDQNGQPVSDVTISEDSNFLSTVTDLDGTYLIEGLTPGALLTVTASDQFGRFQVAQSPLVTVSDLDTVVVDFVLQPIPVTSISGTVTDTNGTPLGGIVVTESQHGAQATSAADGTYVLGGIRPDFGLALTATDPTGLHRDTSVFPPSVAADGSTVVDIAMATQVPSVVGTVTDPDGLPVAGARVQLTDFGISTATGTDGRFSFGELGVDGNVTISVDPRSVRPDLRPVDIPVTLVAGTTVDASVQLSRTATIDVTVLAGGAPADAVVRVWSALQFGGVVATADVRPDGTASLPILTDGDYSLEVESHSPDFASEFFPDTVFRADAQRFTVLGEQHVAVAVDLERSATISGTITMPDGSPGDFTQVAALPVGMSEDQRFNVGTCNLPNPDDPPGTFRIGCLHPSADWLLEGFGNGIADNGYYLDSQSAFNATPIAVDPGQAVTGIDIRLAPKSPNPTITGLSQQYFVTGTTTPGVHVFGTNFPADFHAITLSAQSGAFFFPNIRLTVTAVVSPTELIAAVDIDPADIGPTPIFKTLVMSTSIGGLSNGGPDIRVGDPSTPVASMSGRVTDTRGRGVANTTVVVRSTTPDQFGNAGQFVAGTGPDGRWSLQGITPGAYTVRFDGTEALNPQFWRQKTRQADATPITLRNGDSRTGISASLTRRAPIEVFAASPKFQSTNLSFDLVGQGLGSIRGGFRVSIATGFFGNVPLQAESVSSSRLHVTGFAIPGTWDIVTEWTADDGTVKSTTCVGCIKVYDDLSAVSFDNFVLPGNTATVTYFGQGLVDITKVTVGGRDVKVLGYRTFDGGTIEITFSVKRGAALGSRPVTITRIDGRSTTTDMVVGSFF